MLLKNTIKKFSPRYKARKKAYWYSVNKISQKYGFEFYKPTLSWLRDPDFWNYNQQWKPLGLPNDRRFFLYDTACRLKHIEGDSADIGVRFGTSSYFMLKGLDNPNKTHHLFDSFEGLSEPSAEDVDQVTNMLAWEKGDICVDEQVTRQNLAAFPNCEYHKGWVPDRFPDVADKKFVMVHVDVDLYQPTLDTLRFFYPRISPGGVIICDDYGSTACPGAKKALDDFFANKPETVFHLTSGQSLVVKTAQS